MADTSSLPIKFQELFQLEAVGVNPENVSFTNLTMESDKHICVREKVGDANEVVIIDTADPTNPTRKSMFAESVIMNPEVKVLALRASGKCQIYNLDMKMKMKEYEMSETIEFWKWVDVHTIALVTTSAVYHWSMEGDSNPVKVLTRNEALNGAQIINYRTNSAGTWVVLIGIAAKDNRVVGTMQLHSISAGQSQVIEGHAASFHDYAQEKGAVPNTLFMFAVRTASSAMLQIIEIDHQSSAPVFERKQVDVFFPQEAPADFPVAMEISPKFDTIFLVTRYGYIHLYDVATGACLYMNRISGDTIFVTCIHEATAGLMGVNRKGQVLTVAINEDTLVQYIQSQLNRTEIAVRYASRYGLPGADDLFTAQFQRLFQSGNYQGAAKIAAESPRGILRTPDTIALFQQVQGNPPPLLQYFTILLEAGKLNRIESLELARPVLQQGKPELLEKWLTEDKLECSEELGDLLSQVNTTMALSVYLRANVPQKVIQCFAQNGEYDKIIVYADKVGFTPDWVFILSNMVRANPDGAKDFALKLVMRDEPLADPNQIVDVFTRMNLVPQATAFLLDFLKNNREEEADLQTRLLEMNLVSAPQVGHAILGYEMFTHYDHQKIAEMCEKAGLWQRALENYEEPRDIRRVMTSMNVQDVDQEFLVAFFATLDVDTSLACLHDLMENNMHANQQTVIAVASKYSEQLSPQALIALFEKFNSLEGLFYYLGSIVNFSQDQDVHYKYIEAAAKAGQFKEVERVCRESNFYDPERTKNFLKEARLQDQLPLIIVCDRFNFVDELTRFLYSNQMMKYIEIYIRQVNTARAPVVVGTLLDLDCNEDVVADLINSVRNMCPIDELIAEVEQRNRLKLLQPWLEQRAGEGNTDAPTHNALLKIYIDMNSDAERQLKENDHYDPRVVGKYCEKRDPHLAVVAYTKGQCDDELIELTNAEQMYRDQARYLVGRRDEELWTRVLQNEDWAEHRRPLIDNVVSTALQEANDPEEVSTTVRAFMAAKMPNELIALLEKIVLDGTKFANNSNLQNLLILTAVSAEPDKVSDYVRRLDNYDAEKVASICVNEGLFEDGFTVFAKADLNVQAMKVLIDHIRDLDRGLDFAKKVDDDEVWSTLARAQIDAGEVGAGVDSYIKADSASAYKRVIDVANANNAFEDLVRYLLMARKKLRETVIETELCYAYARVDDLGALEAFVNGPNMANVLDVGERCFGEQLYEAARILFNNQSNYARLATTLVMLDLFQEAVDSAKKANAIRTWKEVNMACVDAGEFKLAQVCGLHIVVNAEELDAIIKFYEERGFFAEIIHLIDAGLGLERAHTGMFTELAVLYTKYDNEALMGHLKLHWKRMNIPKVLRACDAAHLWSELVFLYVRYEEYDAAVQTMIDHPTIAWEHDRFKDNVVRASADQCYKAIAFYLDYQPNLLVELLHAITAQIDPARVVMQLRKAGHTALAKPWLQEVQPVNEPAVNECLNELYIQEEEFTALRESIDNFDAFDNIELAIQCEKHDLLEFRRIAAYIYRNNGRFDQSMELSRKDNLFSDAMATCAASGDTNLAEELLRFFVSDGRYECFAAHLFTCYPLLRPDLVLELSWRNGIQDFAMPYMVQVMKDYTEAVDALQASNSDREAREEEAEANRPPLQIDPNQVQMLTYGPTGNGMGMGGNGVMMNGNQGMGNYYVAT